MAAVSSVAEILLLLVVGPLTGLAAGFALSRLDVLSGRLALAYSLTPYVGFGLGLVYC